MPLAEKYVCYSIKQLQQQVKTLKDLGEAQRLAKDIGMGCRVSPRAAVTIANMAARFLRVRPPKVFIKNVGRGHAHGHGTAITIPHSLLHNPHEKPYVVYYVAHEVAHTHPSARGHDASFKRVERRVLKKFGMGIRYAHAYPRELYALKDGRVLYERGGKQ